MIIDTNNITEQQATEFGEAVIALLRLKPDREFNERVATAWGTKTPLGLGLSVIRLLTERLEETQ